VILFDTMFQEYLIMENKMISAPKETDLK